MRELDLWIMHYIVNVNARELGRERGREFWRNSIGAGIGTALRLVQYGLSSVFTFYSVKTQNID